MIRAILTRIARPLSATCLLVGLLFFAVSLTPSLIPRGPEVQGILGGTMTAMGYLLGQVIALVWRAVDMPLASGRSARGLTWIAAALVLAVFVWVLGSSLTWQNDLRGKMGLAPADALRLARIVGIASVTFGLAILVGRLIALLFWLVRARFYRVMPPRRANVLGFVVVAMVLFVATRDGIVDRVVVGLDESYETAQALFDKAPPQPREPWRTGSAASFVDWGAIGEPGRDYITSGPNAQDISAFTGRPALQPIRVYVGRANASTPRARAELALAELKRLGAFERAVLIMASPTGTGWMDPGAVDPVEFMHGGDIATVAVQYSYLQSPLALVLETRAGLDQAVALQEVIHGYWKTLPVERRPRLYVHGLSLGAWSSMHATNLFRLLDDPIDGAFWAGPPFPSAFWNYVQAQRNPDSPWVLPTIGDGSLVRYASRSADASEAMADWGDMRIVFLQYSSDPVVFFDPASLWRAPQWMREPPAADMSDHFVFMPVVTQFQLALDMALSFGAPPGHGHTYRARDYVGPWAEVTAPKNWTGADSKRLMDLCDAGLKGGCLRRP